MAEAKEGDRVRVHFTGTLESGTIFGATADDEPFEFTLGEGKVLAAFENAVVGMKKGETRTICIPPEDAYGHHKEELIFDIDRSQLPSEFEPEVGKKFRAQLADGRLAILTILGVNGDKLTVDANDPLAGQDLTFEIKLLGIVEKEEGKGGA